MKVLILTIVIVVMATESDRFKERKAFHVSKTVVGSSLKYRSIIRLIPLVSFLLFLLTPTSSANDRLCKAKPHVKTCHVPFTAAIFQEEERLEAEYDKFSRSKTIHTETKRAIPRWASEDDDDYEYFMWKYQREKWRRRMMRPTSGSTEIHYHYHPRPRTYYYPSYSQPVQRQPFYYSYPYYSYPSYSSYPSYASYPSYGYGGGYGGGLFNLGFGRQLGIMTPIGGFGYSSGFNIGIGK